PKNIEVIDVDDAELFSSLREKIEKTGLSEKLLFEKSPHGYHIVYSCSKKIEGNQKLAIGRIPVDGPGTHSWKGRTELKAKELPDGSYIIEPCLVETRGRGGYIICAPSEGYRIIEGDFQKLEPLSSEERNQILEIGRSFNEKEPKKTSPQKETNFFASRPGDAFNRAASEDLEIIEDLLIEEGWKQGNGNKGHLWTRPGKKVKDGNSAELFPDGKFHCYSTNVPELEGGRQYSPFSLLTFLKFDGDFSRAADYVVEEGYETEDFSAEDVEKILRQHPDQLENAYDFSGLSETEVTQIALKNGITGGIRKPKKRAVVKIRDTRLNDTLQAIDQALLTGQGDWGYFIRHGTIGRMTPTGFVSYDKGSMELLIEQVARIKTKARKGWKDSRCPVHIIEKVLAYPSTSALPLIALSRVPTVTQDGNLVGGNGGYDSGIYFAETIPGFQNRLKKEMERASTMTWKACYDELVQDLTPDMLFPSENREMYEAAYISYLLTLVARPGNAGECPGYFFTANEPGTGKSTAIQIGCILVNGTGIASAAWGKTKDERAKLLLSYAREAKPIILHDNVGRGVELNDGAYAEALTSGWVGGRLLGKSESVSAECRSVFIFGGNGITMSQELSRRLIVIKLEALRVDPASRTVAHPDIEGFVKRNRERFLSLLYRMLELGVKNNAENEMQEESEFWKYLVQKPILKNTGVNLLGAYGNKIDEGLEMSNGASVIEIIVRGLFQEFGQGDGQGSFTTRDLFNLIDGVSEDNEDLIGIKDAFTEINARSWVSLKSLGKALASVAGRPTRFGWMVIRKRGKRAVTRYTFRKLDLRENSENSLF
ncbi:MAG: hypothetical protein DSY80_08480, partial [Desulfocapsa sp.]